MELSVTDTLRNIVSNLPINSSIPCPPVKRLDGTDVSIQQIRATLRRVTPPDSRIVTRTISGQLVIYRVNK